MTTCYLLGAGASYGFDRETGHDERPPLGNQLFEVGWKRGILKTANFSELVSEIRQYNNVKTQVCRMDSSALRFENIELFLKYLYENTGDPGNGQFPYDLALSQAYYYIYELFRIITNDYSPNEDAYSRLARSSVEKDISVVTLNYDVLLEKALCANSIAPHYNPDVEYQKSNSVPISKPHGSINWWNKWGVVSHNPDFKHRIRDMPVNRTSFDFVLADFEMLRENSYKDLAPYEEIMHEVGIIPPMESHKDYQKVDVFKDTWRWAETLLGRASELVIIGCSLNPEDVRIRELLRDNLRDKVPITVVSPSPKKIVERIDSIFSDPEISEKYDGTDPFADYANEAL